MQLQDFLDHVDRGGLIEGGSDAHRFMHGAAQEALRTTAELNTGYHTPEQVRALLTRLTGRAVHESVVVFPPLYTSSGRTSSSAKTSSSTSAVASRTPAVSPSATAASSATAPT
jgi:hypothetical protein